jgi:adenosylcobinamide-phosphate synthase
MSSADARALSAHRTQSTSVGRSTWWARSPTAAGLALGAAADLVFADPRRGHPVAGFGRAAAALERWTWRDSRLAGAAYAAACVGAATAVGAAGQRLSTGRPLLRTGLTAAATWAALGGTSLGRAAARMEEHLAAGDLPAARAQLRSLAGRDPSSLGEAELVRATVESVAENTLDAMVGYRSPRYARFGWAAARLDDVLNWVPARTTAVLTVVTAPLTGGSPAGAWRTWQRDGAAHPSPNAGRCEAALAGALGVRLGGRNVYGERVEERPALGDGRSPVRGDVRRAVRLSRTVWTAAAVLAALLRLARRG